MGFLGRLLGIQPPKVPAGGRAFASVDDMDGKQWSVRVAMNGEDPLPTCKRISPMFRYQTTAYAWLDWVGDPKGKPFVYPEGEA